MATLEMSDDELEVLHSCMVYAGDRIREVMVPDYIALRDRIEEHLDGTQ